MHKPTSPHLVIIGAGPGGYTAAFLAADQGINVTLIDTRSSLGGTCLHEGCIPSKTLLSVVHTLAHAKEAKEWGIYFEEPKINIEEIRQFKENTITKLSTGLSQICKQKKIQFIIGKASFVNSKTITIEKIDGTSQTLSFDKCIIATGSKPIKPQCVPERLANVLFSSQALELKEIPQTLLVVGGGYIGVEMASIYAGLGTQVTLCEIMPNLLSGTDQDLVAIALKSLKKKMTNIKLSTSMEKISIVNNGLEVTFNCQGTKTKELFAKILVATGRKPNVASLHLENTKIKQEKNERIKVKAHYQTDDDTIYAIGDVVDGPMLAHKASYEATIVIDAIAGKKINQDNAMIPSVVFTDPEIAYCGLTEGQAKEQNIPIEVFKFPWAANGRAVSLNRTDGLTKLIFDAKKEKLLGAGIVGAEAGELIAQALLSINTKAPLQHLGQSIYPHPTLSETFKECLELSLGKSFYTFKK